MGIMGAKLAKRSNLNYQIFSSVHRYFIYFMKNCIFEYHDHYTATYLTMALSHFLFPNKLLSLLLSFPLVFVFPIWYMIFAFSWLFPICFFQTSCFLGPPMPPTQSVKRPENTLTFLYLDTKYQWHLLGQLLAKVHQLKLERIWWNILNNLTKRGSLLNLASIDTKIKWVENLEKNEWKSEKSTLWQRLFVEGDWWSRKMRRSIISPSQSSPIIKSQFQIKSQFLITSLPPYHFLW